MKRNQLYILLISVVIAACGAIPPAPQPTDSPAAEAQEEAYNPTETQPLYTETPLPMPTDTATMVPPPTLAPEQVICDQAALVAQGFSEPPAELGAPIPPGKEFTYILRVTNTGTCTWTTEYAVVLVDNQGLVVEDIQPFSVTAVPGQTVDIPVQVAAPEDSGSFSASWQFRNPDGETFGYGESGEGLFTLSITVGSYVAGGGGYDFIASRCSAQWDSNRATSLSCTGGDLDDFIGYLTLVSDPELEDSEVKDATVLNIHPDKGKGGFIAGLYPYYKVGSSDHFVAVIGCMGGAPNCQINFELRYENDSGDMGTIGKWTEDANGKIHFVDVDVSALAGQSVRFILYVDHNGGENADSDGFWRDARIVQTGQVESIAAAYGLPRQKSSVAFVPLPSSNSCDAAHLMHPVYKDVPVYDGSSVHPNQTFTAGWRLTNVGTCTWNKYYSIVLVQSDGVVASTTQYFSESVAPGETIDVTFKLTAPSKPGTYNLVWRLRNAGGEFFGYGPNGTGKFSLNFSVLDLPSGWVFDFIAARCQAQWHTNQVSFLPCDSSPNDKLGYVRYIEDPDLEGKSAGNQPVINVNPDNGKKGFIKGIFPPYLVKQGDKFAARIGCMGGVPECRVLFEVMIIKPNGEIAIIGDWTETSDGNTRLVTVDLSKWAGKELQFILFMKDNGGKTSHADGFWQLPRIENPSAP